MEQEKKVFHGWSWPIDMLTVNLLEGTNFPEYFKRLEIGTIDRDSVNLRRKADAETLGKEVTWTTSPTNNKEVAHLGGALEGISQRSMFVKDVLDVFDRAKDGFWARLAQEPGKNTKCEIRFSEIFQNTRGIIPASALDEFVYDLKHSGWVTLINVFINNKKLANGEFAEEKVANIVVVTNSTFGGNIPSVDAYHPMTEDELFFFNRDGVPRIGTKRFLPKPPNYNRNKR